MEKLDKKFKNDRLGLELDIYEHNDKEWFKAQDIAEFLDYSDTVQMTRSLDSMEKHSHLHSVQTSQGNSYQAIFIDEYALYEAILKIRKVNPERYNKAQLFQDWVFGEVLPTIRKYGAYIDPNRLLEVGILEENFKESGLSLPEYLRQKLDEANRFARENSKVRGNYYNAILHLRNAWRLLYPAYINKCAEELEYEMLNENDKDVLLERLIREDEAFATAVDEYEGHKEYIKE